MSDTLSDVLRAVRLTGAVFFSVDASAPWVAEAPRGCVVGPHIMPGVEHVIEYHVVSGGSCWASLLDEPPIQLHEGDVVVFPQGDAHVMSSAPGMRGEPDPELFVRAGQSRLPLAMSMQGGGVERARLVCGFLGCDARPYNPLLAALPRVIHLPASGTSESVARRLVELAVAESNAREAGAECLLARLSELLFIEVVRRYAASMPSEGVGWFSALRDGQIGRALGELHERPAHPWTLEELAKEVGMSRSVLAERFCHFVGVPPIQYLAKWRIQLAASHLRAGKDSLAEIADRVGYGSEAALSRAFKRWVGVAPALYRRGELATATGN